MGLPARCTTPGVSCWGATANGKLGAGKFAEDACSLGPVGSAPCSRRPRVVTGINDATQVSAGSGLACALRASGRVSCWGSNAVGSLGSGSSEGPETCPLPGQDVSETCSRVPIEVKGLSDATHVSVGLAAACVTTKQSEVRCWGANGAGRLGTGGVDGPQTCDVGTIKSACALVPSPVTGLTGAVVVSMGLQDACAGTSTGDVFCWGAALLGGIGTEAPTQPCQLNAYTTRQHACVPIPAKLAFSATATGASGTGSPNAAPAACKTVTGTDGTTLEVVPTAVRPARRPSAL